MTTQPIWRIIANLGDASPLEYGGCFVLGDKTGVYPAEMEVYEPEEGLAYRVILDKFVNTPYGLILDHLWQTYQKMQAGEVMPYAKSLPYPIERYADNEWFMDDLPEIQKAFDPEEVNLVDLLCSNSAIDRAFVYREVGLFYGFENFDSYPLTLTKKEARRRYAKWIKALK